MRVLVTVDEGTGSLAAVRGLHVAGYEPWIAAWQEHTYVGRSRFVGGTIRVPNPADGAEAYVEIVARAAAEARVAAVLPGTEGSLRALAGRQERFAPIALGSCTPGLLDRATDKALLAELCREAGLQTPPTYAVDGASLPAIAFPAVLKPTRSVALEETGSMRSGEVERVESPDELRAALVARSGEELVVQPYLRGSLGAICGVVWEGKLVSAVHQISPRIWPPDRGISSFAVTIPRDHELERGVARLLELVGWSGVYGVQFIVDGDDRYAIDLNPRIYGSTALAIAAGHNLPAIWTSLLLGRTPDVPEYRVGVGYRVEEDDYRALLVQARRGDRAGALRGALPRRRTTHGIFWWKDPAPSLETVRKLLAG